MWLAATACTPAWMTTPAAHPVTVFDAPPLAGAAYVAHTDPGDFGNPGPQLSVEHGRYKCAELVRMVDHLHGARDPDRPDPALAHAKETCDPEVAELLRNATGFLLVVDGTTRRWLSADDVIKAALPVDTPAKALLVVWAKGGYSLGWYDGTREYGSLEDGRVRAVDGGFEVAAGTTDESRKCGGRDESGSVTNLRVTLFVARGGTVTERARTATHHYAVADACHPLGRRPANFADVASGGTVRGHLARAMHHEAESVRAFERIARELRVHGAPGELCVAAEAAARDERDHARRCADLAGLPLAIASDALPVRPLLDLALDNAREGCVGEAYAALVNVVQARTAATTTLRAHYAAIAADELGHAALAHAIADWLAGVLTTDERARVAVARAQALTELASVPPLTDATRALGLPDTALAAHLLATVARVGA